MNKKAGKQKNMAEFEHLFSGLKGAVINTDSEILNLAENTVMFPTMDAEELTLSEELFLKELDGRFKAAFKTEEAEQQEKERFQKVIRLHGGNAVDDILNLLKAIPKHTLGDGDEEYTLDKFKNEGRYRVMTGDHYRIYNDLSRAYEKEVKLLDDYFSRFTAHS